MKFIFGLILIVLIAEKGNAIDVFSRIEKSFRYQNQNDSGVQLFKAERVFVPANPDSSTPTNLNLKKLNAPKGYGVNYIEVFESSKPEYAGTDVSVKKFHIANPQSITVHLRNSAGKGIDARVLYYVYKN